MVLKMRSDIRLARRTNAGPAIWRGLASGGLLQVAFALSILSILFVCRDTSGAIARYRVFMLKHISPQNGIRLLADVNITAVSQLNDSNMLLVTGEQEMLAKTASLLNLVDSREQYAVKVLLPVSEANWMPKVDAAQAEISEKIGGVPVSIGTFFNPPGGTGHKVIIDAHNDMLIAVAPVEIMDKIIAIAERSRPAPSGSPDLNELVQEGQGLDTSEPNTLFNDLLNSISEAEKLTVPSKEPNRPKSVKEAVSQIVEPNAGPAEPNVAAAGEERGRSYEPQSVPNANETLELELPEKIQIIPLLDLVGKYLNLNYIYDEKKIQGLEVNLKVQGKIKVGELYPLVESVLKFTGLAMTRKGNLVTIVPMAEAIDIDPALIEAQRGEVKAGDVVVTRIFQLNYIDNTSAKNLLDQMKVGVITDGGPGTIIVTGYAYRMNRIEQLLEVIDKPGRPKQFKFRQLRYTLAKTLAPKVKQLVEQMGDISIAIAAPQPTPQQPTRRPGPPGARPGTQPQQPATQDAAKTAIYLDADERTNRILMIGHELELAVVNDLIDSLDVQQQDLRSLRVYEIQHVGAEDVRKKLEELGVVGASKSSTAPSGRITTRAAAGPGQPGAPPSPTPSPSPAGGEAELPTEELQVVVLESTNSLMVNASPEQHALIAVIIAYVDSESIRQAIPYVVYPLQNQPPDHVAQILEKLVQEVVRDKEGKIEKVLKKTEEDIIIVPDPNTFSLIVYASKKNQDWIASLIKTLDRRRPQVLIDVTLVEVTNTDAFDLDLQVATKLPQMIPGQNMDLLGSIIGGRGDTNSFLSGTRKEGFSNPRGKLARGFYSDEHIQALLTALETKSYGRVLAKPKILVNDGQRGVIKTTDTTNVAITGQTLVGGTGNTSIVTSTTYQPYTAGITLEIQPNISEGDLLLLLVKLDRSDFLSRSSTDVPPDTRSNTVDTIVTVPNDKTIILGGLLKLNQSKGGSKVPLLGDIPLIGGMFRSTSNSVIDSKLYVFVKANILRPEEGLTGLPELERISERNRAAFEKNEDRFQNNQDWPGIKPKPVDPVKVLEAE